MRKGKLTFLGTGASLGVPVVGCDCEVCHSNSSLNKRFRTSCLIEIDQKTFLLDCGPDFRQQALKHSLATIDGLILTHAHFDHIAGIDDLRPLCFKKEEALPILLSKETLHSLKKCYDYLFFDTLKGAQRFSTQILEGEEGSTIFLGIPFKYISFVQMGMKVNGFVIGDLGFVSDIKEFDKKIIEQLKGLKTLIISALRFTKSNMHLSVDEALEFGHKTGAEKIILVHLSHDLDHQKATALLPANAKLSFDGMEVEFYLAH